MKHPRLDMNRRIEERRMLEGKSGHKLGEKKNRVEKANTKANNNAQKNF